METLKLIAAFGIGAIAIKLIDTFWVQPFLEKREKRKWFRERRFEAYSYLAANLLSFGLNDKPENEPFKHLAAISPALLLANDENFTEKIYSFISKRQLMFDIHDDKRQSAENPEILYHELVEESKILINQLKKHLKEDLA